MNALMWALLGVVSWLAVIVVLLLVLRANKVTPGDDAEQRRIVSRPATLGSGDAWDAEKLRREGLL